MNYFKRRSFENFLSVKSLLIACVALSTSLFLCASGFGLLKGCFAFFVGKLEVDEEVGS